MSAREAMRSPHGSRDQILRDGAGFALDRVEYARLFTCVSYRLLEPPSRTSTSRERRDVARPGDETRRTMPAPIASAEPDRRWPDGRTRYRGCSDIVQADWNLGRRRHGSQQLPDDYERTSTRPARISISTSASRRTGSLQRPRGRTSRPVELARRGRARQAGERRVISIAPHYFVEGPERLCLLALLGQAGGDRGTASALGDVARLGDANAACRRGSTSRPASQADDDLARAGVSRVRAGARHGGQPRLGIGQQAP
jgi:hypothetical protein